jgi:PAS domain S-box-containing protein
VSSELPTVVLVDDASDVRALVRARLRLSRRFAVVGEGSTGTDAVALAEQHRPSLLLLDVSMPVMDGLEALPLVREASPQTRVVLYSGFEEQGLIERGRDLGAAAFLEKSASVERLPDELARVLGGEEPADGVEPASDTRSEAADVDERLLADHAERFREVFEEAVIGMGTMTLNGHVVRANKALAALLDRPAAELVGRPYAAAAIGEGRDEIAAAVAALCDGAADAVEVDHEISTRSGTRRVLATLAAVRGDRRQPLYLSLQALDVTDQRRAAEALRQSEERFRLLVEAVEDYAIFMLDTKGHVASWNTGAHRIKGYTADEIIGQHFRVFYPADKQLERHPEMELTLALRDGRYEEEGWRIRKDGSTFWANVVISAIRNPEGEHVGFAKITRDVTARRATLEEQERSATVLAEVNDRLEAMNQRLLRAAADQSQFLAVTAHELRGPVGVLGGSADMLKKHWADLTEGERTEMFDGMSASAARIQRLLGDLLTAARLEAGAVQLDRRSVPVSDVLMHAATSAHQLWPGDEVLVDCPSGLEVVADPDRFAQAVDNLVSNALRHGVAPVRLTAARVEATVEIRVSDRGPGVPDAVRGRLFERFATGERRGTGLGLFIVRELARAQGGDAWYEADGPDGPAHAFVLALPAA